MRVLSLLSILAILLLSMNARSQSACGDFKTLNASCINNAKVEYSEKPFTLGKLKSNAILFYKTTSGEPGKMRVLSVLNNPSTECTVFIEAVTFAPDRPFIPNSSLSISPDKSHWLSDRTYLDREGLSALVLEKVSREELEKQKSNMTGEPLPENRSYTAEEEISRSRANCLLIPTKGVQFAIVSPGSEEKHEFKESLYLLQYAAFALIFIAIFLIVRVFMEDQDKYKTQEALEEAENSGKIKDQALFLKITKPFYKRYFLPMIQASKNKQGFRTKYRQKLAMAGLTKEMSPEEFVALKFFMIIGGPFAFLAVRYIMDETWPLTITPVMGVVGYFYPDIWLDGSIKRRQDAVLRAMPFIVDMLALSVEAGLDFMAAIQRVIEKAPPSPLVEEFETLIKETKIGSSRAEGLRQLGWRVNVIEINSFCATLIAADSVGASIGPLLKQLSNELRVKRSSRAEQLGATAATKILIPMIFFILPAVLVAIFAPMVLKMMSGGGGG